MICIDNETNIHSSFIKFSLMLSTNLSTSITLFYNYHCQQIKTENSY